jgi:hypothetical protein
VADEDEESGDVGGESDQDDGIAGSLITPTIDPRRLWDSLMLTRAIEGPAASSARSNWLSETTCSGNDTQSLPGSEPLIFSPIHRSCLWRSQLGTKARAHTRLGQ